MSGRVTHEMRAEWDDRLAAIIDEHTRDLTEWEEEFVDALQMARAVGRDLSWNQSKKLRSLWEEVV